MNTIILSVLFLCISSTPASSSLSKAPKDFSFPILPSYLKVEDGCLKWLPLISGIIMLRHQAFGESCVTCTTDEASIIKRNDELAHSLWQVFVPGSWIDKDNELIDGLGDDPHSMIKINKVFVEPWQVLQDRQVLMIYSTMISGNIETRELRYRRPGPNVISTLILYKREGMWHGTKDAPILLFHAFQDVTPKLNPKIIEIVTRGIGIQRIERGFHLSPATALGNPELSGVMSCLGEYALPAAFPTTSTAKLIRAGFLPLLPTYRHDRSVMDADHYMIMIKRIIAYVIQTHIHMIYQAKPTIEASVLRYGLHHHLQYFLPGCAVASWMVSRQQRVFAYDIDSQGITSIVLYSEPLGDGYLTMTLELDNCTKSPMAISQFLHIRPVAFPNLFLLRERRFGGISTTIYNSATSSTVIPIDFEPLARQHLTSYSVIYAANPRVTRIPSALPHSKDIVFVSSSFVLRRGEVLLVLPGVTYNPHTTIAYGDDILYSVHVPFIILESVKRTDLGEGERAFDVIVVKHKDEPEQDINAVISSTFSEY